MIAASSTALSSHRGAIRPSGLQTYRSPVPWQRWHFTTLSPFLTRPLPSQFLHLAFFLTFGPFSLAMMISKVRSARRIATEGDALSAYPRDEQWHSPIERYQSRKTARGVDERGVIHAFPGRKRPAFRPCAINPPSFVASRHAGTRSLDHATGRATTHLCAHALPRAEMTGSAISRSDFQNRCPRVAALMRATCPSRSL